MVPYILLLGSLFLVPVLARIQLDERQTRLASRLIKIIGCESDLQNNLVSLLQNVSSGFDVLIAPSPNRIVLTTDNAFPNLCAEEVECGDIRQDHVEIYSVLDNDVVLLYNLTWLEIKFKLLSSPGTKKNGSNVHMWIKMSAPIQLMVQLQYQVKNCHMGGTELSFGATKWTEFKMSVGAERASLQMDQMKNFRKLGSTSVQVEGEVAIPYEFFEALGLTAFRRKVDHVVLTAVGNALPACVQDASINTKFLCAVL